jgi:hypothetical protein
VASAGGADGAAVTAPPAILFSGARPPARREQALAPPPNAVPGHFSLAFSRRAGKVTKEFLSALVAAR